MSEPRKESRAMPLAGIIQGRQVMPPRTMVYGVHGIGKSTWAAKSPNAIFIPTEEGANEIDVPKFPVVESLEETMSCLRSLYAEKHSYHTVVIDAADSLEQFIIADLKEEFTSKELGYGKDSVLAMQRGNEVLAALNALRAKRNMSVIIIAHSEVKRFDSPMSEPYDRYRPKLLTRFNQLIQEWADAVLFASFDVIIQKTDVGFNREVRRGSSSGERILYTEERPAFIAKNRYSLPEEIGMTDFSEFAKHVPWFASLEDKSEPDPKAGKKTKDAPAAETEKATAE